MIRYNLYAGIMNVFLGQQILTLNVRTFENVAHLVNQISNSVAVLANLHFCRVQMAVGQAKTAQDKVVTLITIAARHVTKVKQDVKPKLATGTVKLVTTRVKVNVHPDKAVAILATKLDLDVKL